MEIVNTWICPTCKKELPSGIVGISNHWSKCGGKKTYEAIKKVFDDKNSTFADLKKVIDNEH